MQNKKTLVISGLLIVVILVLVTGIVVVAGILINKNSQNNSNLQPTATNTALPKSSNDVFVRLNCEYYRYSAGSLTVIAIPESPAKKEAETTDTTNGCYETDKILTGNTVFEQYNTPEGNLSNVELVDLAKATRTSLGKFENTYAFAITPDEKQVYSYSAGGLAQTNLDTKATTVLLKGTREQLGRGGIMGDEESITFNNNNTLFLVNDTLTYLSGNPDAEVTKLMVFDLNGKKIVELPGYKARWLTDSKIIVMSETKFELSSYDINTKQTQVIYSDATNTDARIKDLQVGNDKIYIYAYASNKESLTVVLDATTFTKLPVTIPSNLDGAINLDSDNYLAFETNACELNPDTISEQQENKPGQVVCPIEGDTELYTYKLVVWNSTTGAVTTVMEFPVSYV